MKKIVPPDLRESRGSRPLECRSNRTSSSRLNGELYSAPELINLILTWPRSVGRSHLGVHHRQAVSQLQTWRSFLVRERWMAFLIHSWAGQKSFLHLHRLDHWFPKQLEEIRRIKLSRVICDNSDKIEDIQVHSGLRKFGPQHSDRAPGVRDGAPWPRDQPAGAVHLQPAAQDRPDQVTLVKTKCVGIAENCEKGKFKQMKL